MREKKTLWWRVLGGLVLAAAGVLWAALAATYLLGTPGHLILMPRRWALSFQVQPRVGQTSLALVTRRTADVLRGRLPPGSRERGVEVEALPGGRIDVRTPVDGRSDPDPILDLLKQTGALEFRMAAGPAGVPLEQARQEALAKLLADAPPTGPPPDAGDFAWFRMAASAGPLSGLIQANHAGRSWVLLSNEPNHTMLRDYRDGGWSVVIASFEPGPDDKPAVGFVLDEVGAARFQRLTSCHVGQSLAIVLDGEVLSAPRIASAISGRGLINGSFTLEEANRIARVLRAGALPGDVNPEPIGRVMLPPVPPSPPTVASAKRWLLWVLAAAGAGALALGARSAWRGRLAGLGLWGVGLIAVAGAWWGVVAWRNDVAVWFCRLAWFANALLLVALLTVGSVAGLQARRAGGRGNVEGTGGGPDRV